MLDNVKLVKYRGYYAAAWRQDGETKRQSLRTTDRAAALRNLEHFKQENTAALSLINHIVPAYLEDRRGKVSYERMRDAWKPLQRFFGAMCVDDLVGQLGRRQSRAYAAARGVGPATVRRELSVLRAALRWQDAQTRAVIELPKAPPPRERYLTHDEVDHLIEAATWLPHLQLFILLAYYTAARKGALLGLTWTRVDLVKRLIRLDDAADHGNKRRAIVPMAENLFEPLVAAQAVALSPHVIEYNGSKVGSIRHSFMLAAERAGLGPDVTPHVLRHTAAVHMAEAGVPIPEIGQYLGHTNSAITYSTYARYSPDYLRGAVAALDRGRVQKKDEPAPRPHIVAEAEAEGSDDGNEIKPLQKRRSR